MADNSTLPASGDVIRDKDRTGVKTQIVALDLNPAGAESLMAGSMPITAASLPLPTGAATEATLALVSGTDITTPTAMPAGGVGIRGWLSAIWTKLNGTLGVTGTFWQATQPVSLATNTPDVTDRSARLLGTIANTSFAVTNAGTFAVQAAATLAAETTKVIGTVNLAAAQTLATVTNLAQLAGTAPVMKAASTAAAAADAALVVALSPNSSAYPKESAVVGTVLSAANTTATLTIASGGAGLFLYISRIRITMHNTSAAAVAGSAVALAFTSTNMPGSLAWTEGNALAAGTSKTVCDEALGSPIKTSAAATATTIVTPACGAGVQARATVYGYYAP